MSESSPSGRSSPGSVSRATGSTRPLSATAVSTGPIFSASGPDGGEAIEVELSVKGAGRLDAILRAWRFAVAERRIAGVVYHCAPRVRPAVEKAVARTATGEMIEVVDLDSETGTNLLPRAS